MDDFYVVLDGYLELPKDLEEKHEWEFTGKILGLNETGQGEVFLMRQISRRNQFAALKIYKRTNERTKRLRCHRERIALDMIKQGKTFKNNAKKIH